MSRFAPWKLTAQWCDNAFSPDCGKIDADNIKMHSDAERRFRCTTYQRTFSADKGKFFETLRTPRPIHLDVSGDARRAQQPAGRQPD